MADDFRNFKRWGNAIKDESTRLGKGALFGFTKENMSTQGKAKQRQQGVLGATPEAVTGSAVNSGVGTPESKPQLGAIDAQTLIDEQNTGLIDPVQAATSSARANASPIPAAVEYGPTPADAPRSQEPTRVGGYSDVTPARGGGTLSILSPGESGDGIASQLRADAAALKDLRDQRLKLGAYKPEDRPVTVIGGYTSYKDDLDAYNSGDVGSAGYNRIRTERLNLGNQLSEATKNVKSPQAKAGIIGSILGAYSEQQKARLEAETNVQTAELASDAATAKARYEAQSGSADRQMNAMIEQEKLNMDRLDLQRKAAADSQAAETARTRLGLDVNKFMQESAFKDRQYGLNERKQQFSEEAGVASAADRAYNTRLKQAELELEAYKTSVGDVDPEVRDSILRKYGLL